MTAASIILATPIVSVFTKEPETFALADAGFKIFAVNFLFSGVNLVSSGFFTALSNGKASAWISFARTLLFMVGFLLILPQIFGDGSLGRNSRSRTGDAVSEYVAAPEVFLEAGGAELYY